jgi:hypothetical protein
VTIFFLCNKKVDKFLLDLCFGESSFQFLLRFKFDFLIFFSKKRLNIQWLPHHKSKQYEITFVHPYSPRVFQQYQLCNERHDLVWGISRWKKKKQPFLMDRFFYFPLFHFIFMFLLVMVLNFCGSMLFIFFPISWTSQKLDHLQKEWAKFHLYMKYESENI